jgi:BirA family biotin operon repressor/biotin-[acetyl-CoA-carboxylase] ligase
LKYYHFSEVTSTNDFAKELLDQKEIVCVTASNQTKGRGRNQNKWFGSLGNNLYISFGIRHIEPITLEKVTSYQSLGALVVYDVLHEIIRRNEVTIKYPNDLYINDNERWKKISGILIEHGFSGSNCVHSIIGIGLNINETDFPAELQNTSTSLKLLGYNFQPDEVQKIIIDKFSLLLELDEMEIMKIWTDKLNLIGKEVQLVKSTKEISPDFNGKYYAKEILPDGRLVIENETEQVIIDNGDSIRYNLD